MSNKNIIKIKNNIILNIKKMNKSQYIEILKIIKDNDMKYTENMNGIYINLNLISDEILIRINEFIKYILSQNIELLKNEKKRNKIKSKIS